MSNIQWVCLFGYAGLFFVKLFWVLKQQHTQLAMLLKIHKFWFLTVVLMNMAGVIFFKQAIQQYYLANLVLFYVMFSASMKLLQAEVANNQRKAGLFINAVACFFVMVLLVWQPGGVIVF